MSRITRLTAALVLILLASTEAGAQGLFGCSTLRKNQFVRDAMSDIYLWYQYVPSLDPARFNSPEAYLEALRYRTLDETFSYITSKAASDALFSNSEYVGFGFSTLWRDEELRVSQVFPESPAQGIGLRRGDRIVEIDGRSVAQLVQDGTIGDAFGAAEEGVRVDVVFTQDDVRRTGRMVKRAVTIPSVSDTRALDVGGRRVGYVFFRNFVEPSVEALDKTFAELRTQHVTELVLDLRYNGGGLVNVAQHLGGLIGGSRTGGQVFAVYSHNDRNQSLNRIMRFAAPSNSLNLDRVFVITTRGTASASELVINALRPFIPVIVVGDRTYGKPVGQYTQSFCDMVFAPVSFALRNADGQGDFFDGLQPTCRANDDLDHAVGDPVESSFAEALFYLSAGTCSSPQALQRVTSGVRVPAGQPYGWRFVLGAD